MSRARSVALAVVAAAALAGGVALAQQPQLQRPAPSPVQPRPLPNLPPGHIQPGMQPGMQRPGFPPGMPPGARPPGFPGGRVPPGFPGRPQGLGPDGRPIQRPNMQRPAQHQAPVQAEEEHGGHEHECPGHGPMDAPPPPNFWHGLLMVNNEAAEKGGFLNQLLFRYDNTNDPCDPKNEPPPFLASLINFGVLCYILYRFGRKPLAEALLKRKQTIMSDIETATKLREDAERRLDEYQDKIDNIAQKLASVRAEYAAQAEQEKKRILAEAEERRVRMRRDAELRVEQETKAARAQLLREAVEGAVAAAEALLDKQVTAADLDRMAGDYLKSVGAAMGRATVGGRS